MIGKKSNSVWHGMMFLLIALGLMVFTAVSAHAQIGNYTGFNFTTVKSSSLLATSSPSFQDALFYNGEFYAANSNYNMIDVFNSKGIFIRNFSLERVSGANSFSSLATNGTHFFMVNNSHYGTPNNATLYVFTNTGALVDTFSTQPPITNGTVPGGNFGSLAYDSSANLLAMGITGSPITIGAGIIRMHHLNGSYTGTWFNASDYSATLGVNSIAYSPERDSFFIGYANQQTIGEYDADTLVPTGINFSFANSPLSNVNNVVGLAWNGTHLFSFAFTEDIQVFMTNGTRLDGFSTKTGATVVRDIEFNNATGRGYIVTDDATTNRVYEIILNGTSAYFSGFQFDTSYQEVFPTGLAIKNNQFYILGNNGGVLVYDANGAYTGTNYSVYNGQAYRGSLDYDGTFFWTRNGSGNYQKWDASFNYIGSYNLSLQVPFGSANHISFNGDYTYVADVINSSFHQFYTANLSYTGNYFQPSSLNRSATPLTAASSTTLGISIYNNDLYALQRGWSTSLPAILGFDINMTTLPEEVPLQHSSINFSNGFDWLSIRNSSLNTDNQNGLLTLGYTNRTEAMTKGLKKYSSSGHFVSDPIRGDSTLSRWLTLDFTAASYLNSRVRGLAYNDNNLDNGIGLYMNNNSHFAGSSGALNNDVTMTSYFTDTYSCTDGSADVAFYGWDGSSNRIGVAFDRSGGFCKTASNSNINTNNAFTSTTGIWNISKGFNVSGIVAMLTDTSNAVLLFDNGSLMYSGFANFDTATSFIFTGPTAEYFLPAGFDYADVLGGAHSFQNNQAGLLMKNGTWLVNQSSWSCCGSGENMYFDRHYKATTPSGVKLRSETNMTLRTRVSNDTVSWSPWSSIQTDGLNVTGGNIGEYIQFNASYTTDDSLYSSELSYMQLQFDDIEVYEVFITAPSNNTLFQDPAEANSMIGNIGINMNFSFSLDSYCDLYVDGSLFESIGNVSAGALNDYELEFTNVSQNHTAQLKCNATSSFAYDESDLLGFQITVTNTTEPIFDHPFNVSLSLANNSIILDAPETVTVLVVNASGTASCDVYRNLSLIGTEVFNNGNNPYDLDAPEVNGTYGFLFDCNSNLTGYSISYDYQFLFTPEPAPEPLTLVGLLGIMFMVILGLAMMGFAKQFRMGILGIAGSFVFMFGGFAMVAVSIPVGLTIVIVSFSTMWYFIKNGAYDNL